MKISSQAIAYSLIFLHFSFGVVAWLPQDLSVVRRPPFIVVGSKSRILSYFSSVKDDEGIQPMSPTSSSPSLTRVDKDEHSLDFASSLIDMTDSSNGKSASSGAESASTRRLSSGLSVDDLMLAMGTNPRRIFLSTISATGIALAGNFLGVTSRILTAIPEEQVEATGIDTYFPRGDYKRCLTDEYTFVVPKEWVADTFVELAKAERKIRPLDFSMQQRSKAEEVATLPDSAYGPAGRLNKKGVSESGDTNVSVIVSTGLSGFSLQETLGTPTNAAEKLLSFSIAPEGSGRTATLLSVDQDGQNYKFEYLLDRGGRGPPLRNIAVITASPTGDRLYTLTVMAPAEKWKQGQYEAQVRKIANSFHLRFATRK